MDDLYHIAISIEHHICNSDCTENQSENHEDDTCDHARNHAVSSGIAEERTDQEAADRDTYEPNQTDQAELVEVGHIDIKTAEEQRVYLGVQARVDVIVGDLAQAAGQCDIDEEDHAADSHHDVEHILVSLTHDHRHMMLLHFLWDYDRHKDHQSEHEKQNVAFTGQHEWTIDIVTNVLETFRI